MNRFRLRNLLSCRIVDNVESDQVITRGEIDSDLKRKSHVATSGYSEQRTSNRDNATSACQHCVFVDTHVGIESIRIASIKVSLPARQIY